ncbi:MAG: ATP-binding domain-containing protein [Gammaproteobacteria bacterium]|nr:ATP-binding domain-containing protein [Gammaproteobacteria bacterium]
MVAIKELTETLNGLGINGTFYIGYPILAAADESIAVDALLVADGAGLVIFHIPHAEEVDLRTSGDIENLRNTQDNLFVALENSLGRHPNLRKRRRLAVAVNVVSYFPDLEGAPDEDDLLIAEKGTLQDVLLSKCKRTEAEYLPALYAAIQGISAIKPAKKRANVKDTRSKGAILQKIEKEIANLDRWQKQAAIETPDGPQRIRGLAGSGKTVVLALKAACLHCLHPEWNIAVTFHTRSLYRQFRELIRRFTFEQSNDEPDWDKLRILHAWGSPSQSGLYAEIASRIDFPVRNYLYGKTKYGMEKAFEGVCGELLQAVRSRRDMPHLYDAVLIDEAQDLPALFFKMVYKFLGPEKRVVWAYDELQNFSTCSGVPQAEFLFGENESGQPKVTLTNPKDDAHQDISLPVCYRNTPWALTLAHALGFGVYRKEGFVQFFDDDAAWSEIGYELTRGQFQPNTPVSIRRKTDSYPDCFEKLLAPEDAVSCHCFDNFEQEEVNWIADQVLKNLQEDELEPDDILIVLPDAWTAKSKAGQISQALGLRAIPAHIAGVMSSVDEMFVSGSVSLAHISRAKGNEAPMVYVANSDYCASGPELIKLRNSLFTAITRSRAWVRISGCGAEMDKIKEEFDVLAAHKFSLDFTLPDEKERERLRIINRDRIPAEKAKIKQVEDGLKKVLELVKRYEIDSGSISPELRKEYDRIMREEAI